MFIKVVLDNGIEHRTECMHYSAMDDTQDDMAFTFFAETDLRNKQVAREIKIDKRCMEVYIENYLGKTVDIYRWNKKGVKI